MKKNVKDTACDPSFLRTLIRLRNPEWTEARVDLEYLKRISSMEERRARSR